jgi:membrane-associated phospholipid phosphatase
VDDAKAPLRNDPPSRWRWWGVLVLWIVLGSTAVVGIGLALAPLVLAADARWPVSIPDYRTWQPAVWFRTLIYPLGKGEIQLAVVLALGLMGARKRAAGAVAALAIVALSVAILKPVVGRERPTGTPDSYPSGDTASAAAAAVPLAAGSWVAAPVAVAVVGAVATFRVLDGVHHPGDVITGAFLGTLCGLLGLMWERRRAPRPPDDRPGAVWFAVCLLFIAWGALVDQQSHAVLGGVIHVPLLIAGIVWMRWRSANRPTPDGHPDERSSA